MTAQSVGKIYVELDLDASRYTKGQQRLYKDATQTTLNIEANFKKLGIKSSAEMDLMRAKITNAYNRIANSSKATANDILRAEKAKNEQLKRLHNEQYGYQTTFFQSAKANWRAYAVSATAAIYTVQRVLATSRAEYKEFNTALVDMGKVTDRSLVTIRQDIMDLPTVLGDATSLMKGYYQTISAGVTDPTRALGLLTTAAKSAKAAHVDQSETIKALTKMMAGFEGQIRSTEDAADLLFTTEKLGQTTVSELVPIIGDISKASMEAGVNQYEMAAALALITQTAGSTSEAATQYRSILMGLLRPNEQLTELIEGLGYKTGVAMVKEIGFADTLKQVREQAERTGTQIGKLFRSSEGMLGLASLGVDQFEVYKNQIVKVGEGAGSAEKAFEEWRGSAEAVDEELRNNLKKSMIELGESLSPTVNAGVKALSATFAGLAKSIREAREESGKYRLQIEKEAIEDTLAGKLNPEMVLAEYPTEEGLKKRLKEINSTLDETYVDLWRVKKEFESGLEKASKDTKNVVEVMADEQKRIKKLIEEYTQKEIDAQQDLIYQASNYTSILDKQNNVVGVAIEVGESWRETEKKRAAEAEKAAKKETERIKNMMEAQRHLYEDLRGYEEDFYKVTKRLIDKQAEDYRKLGIDEAAIIEWVAEETRKAEEKKILASNDFFAGVMVGLSETEREFNTWAEHGRDVVKEFASSSRNTMSDVLFDAIKGDLKDLSDYWDSFWDGMLRKITDTVADMATEWVVGEVVQLVSGIWHQGLWQSPSDHLAIIQEGEMVIPTELTPTVQKVLEGIGETSFSSSAVAATYGVSATGMEALGIVGRGLAESVLGNVSGLSEIGDIAAGDIGSTIGTVLGYALGGYLGLQGGPSGIIGIMGNLASSVTGITGAWGNIGEIIGGFFGNMSAGPFGSVLGGIFGSVVGDFLGDVFNARGDEVAKDAFENVFGYWGGRQAYSSWSKDITNAIDAITGAAAPGAGGFSWGAGWAEGGYGYGAEGEATSFREGGVSTGPETGYPARLHGIEAVVPLSGGRSIPVDIHSGGNDDEIVAEIRRVGQAIHDENYVMAKHLIKISKNISRWENDGIPAERTT